MNSINSLHDTVADLKEIVVRNQGANHESSRAVGRIEEIVAEIERKAQSKAVSQVVIPQAVQPVPLG